MHQHPASTPASRRRPVALVTGARRGIGRGIALALARRGFDIVANDIEEDEATHATLRELAAAGAQVHFIRASIADVDRAEAFAADAFARFGTLDVLVNNAGVQVRRRGDILEVRPDDYDALMAVNLRGTFFLTQAVARAMVQEPRQAGDPPRSIITISSVNTTMLSANRSEYCMGKAALTMLNKQFALRLAPHGICCHEVRPGLIDTDLISAEAKRGYQQSIEQGLVPLGRWGSPDDVGAAVAALAAHALPYSTGDAFHVDGGLHIHRL